MEKHWKNKVQEILHVCQGELKKTTEIGKKMLSASTTNSELHNAYEELGHIIKNKIENEEVIIDDPKVHEVIKMINDKEKTLEEIEKEVKKIKISPGVKDISKEN
tara:strand:+ start:1246 stop:1560 length:315 start_codon:yes stop_codon:yes gene_type:complete